MLAPGKAILNIKYIRLWNWCRWISPTVFFVLFTNSLNSLNSFFLHFLRIFHVSCLFAWRPVHYIGVAEIFLLTQRALVSFLYCWKGTCRIVSILSMTTLDKRCLVKCFIHLISLRHWEHASWTQVFLAWGEAADFPAISEMDPHLTWWRCTWYIGWQLLISWFYTWIGFFQDMSKISLFYWISV